MNRIKVIERVTQQTRNTLCVWIFWTRHLNRTQKKGQRFGQNCTYTQVWHDPGSQCVCVCLVSGGWGASRAAICITETEWFIIRSRYFKRHDHVCVIPRCILHSTRITTRVTIDDVWNWLGPGHEGAISKENPSGGMADLNRDVFHPVGNIVRYDDKSGGGGVGT